MVVGLVVVVLLVLSGFGVVVVDVCFGDLLYGLYVMMFN